MKVSAIPLALAACLVAVTPAFSDTLVGSWNVKHLGWDNDKDITAVARIASAFDLVALQEVMSMDGLQALETELEHLTGEDWQSMASDEIGRGSYRERYAFLWQTDEVTWLDGAVVFIDDRDAFSREPFSMRFETADAYRFVLASAHLIWGDSQDEREVEAAALASYRRWLDESFPETPVYIAGDFNLAPDNAAWQGLGEIASPLVTDGATTLSPVDGRFANLYDNIWVPAGTPLPVAASGILDFPSELGLTHETARTYVTDHAPVWMLLDPGSDWIERPPHVSAGAYSDDKARELTGAADAPIRGNRTSSIYHLESCPGYDQMADRNIVAFETEADAIASGYRMARNC
ncbi:hypothetical protein OCH239_09835 [Roseivivax halodurans JCM 10272]|uniref:Endonuclease/exonuclease/phosphatase domain-containing protein n=1 Tax=Roseivivax halodurans JCM 10272 TaxID=1449350 RepID=X7ECH0_9RHOB|nr:endonuclease/exonuclease/phosphatase family protein [Roseivivax halodurans]ETX13570.1 hypothetical protein OCH239_09835 [Roseivivax halodurans JCM 10272]